MASDHTEGYRTIFEESVSATTATPSVTVGTKRLHGGKEYIYTYNSGSTLNKNATVSVDVTNFVAAADTAGYGTVTYLGVLTEAAIPAGNYGWVSINGYVAAEGDTGIQGITGIRGITGIDGITGIQGITGTIGITGIDGGAAWGVTGSNTTPAGTVGVVVGGVSYKLLWAAGA